VLGVGATTGCASRRAVELEGVPVRAATVDEPVPGTPRAVLAEGAQALDVSVRQLSLGQLVRHSELPGGGGWTPRALLDPSPYVQRRAIEALGDRLPEPEAATELLQVLKREGVEPYTRGMAGTRLAAQGDARALAPLQAALSDVDEAWAQAPLALPCAMLGDTDALALLQAGLRRGDFPLELDFFLALGNSGLTGLREPLAEGAGRLEEDLIAPAAASLVRLGSPAGEALFREMLSAPDPELRLQALDFLAPLEGDVAAGLIAKATGPGPASVSAYAELVQLARGEGTPRDALAFSRSIDREDRQQAVWALGHYLVAVPDPKQEGAVRERLDQALDDVELLVVHEALKALARAGVPDDLPALEELMQQEFVAVRVAAASAILEIESRAATPATPPTG